MIAVETEWSDLAYIFKVEMIVFAGLLDMGCERSNCRILLY